MTIQYDGSRYSGWQRQGNTSATIQHKLEHTISYLTGEQVEISGAGRTDAGVHALGQTANFRLSRWKDPAELLSQLNQALPEDIYISDLQKAGERFHARLSAKEKVYRYTIQNGIQRDVFWRKYSYYVPKLLDIASMQDTAKLLIGTHDFRGFSSGHTKKSTIRSLSDIAITAEENKIYLTFIGNGFLYNMVRILSGTLIEAGLGKRTPESVLPVLSGGDRSCAGFTAPAQGLCLMEVRYG